MTQMKRYISVRVILEYIIQLWGVYLGVLQVVSSHETLFAAQPAVPDISLHCTADLDLLVLTCDVSSIGQNNTHYMLQYVYRIGNRLCNEFLNTLNGWANCSHTNSTTFKCGLPMVNAHYCMRTKSISGLSRFKYKRFSPCKIVRRSPVKDFKKQTSYDSISLFWIGGDAMTFGKICNGKMQSVHIITFTSEYGTEISKWVKGKKLHQSEGITPYTAYNISIITASKYKNSINKTVAKEYWSVSTTYTVKTDETVPGATPEVTTGSYHRLSVGADGTQHLTLHWKAIPKTQQNGQLHSITVTVFSSTDLSELSQLVPSKHPMHSMLQTGDIKNYPNTHQIGNGSTSIFKRHYMFGGKALYGDVAIPAHHSAQMFVQAATSAGVNTSLILMPIVLSQEIRLPQIFIVQTNGTRLFFSWTSEEELNLTCTIYWCLLLQCKNSSINWIHLNHSLQSVEIDISSLAITTGRVHTYTYALSTEQTQTSASQISSGMRFARCVYDIRTGIKFPKFNAHATLRNNVWEVKITWNHLNCEESAFIEKYTFKFNNTEGNVSRFTTSDYATEVTLYDVHKQYVDDIQVTCSSRWQETQYHRINVTRLQSLSSDSTPTLSKGIRAALSVSICLMIITFITILISPYIIYRCALKPVKITIPAIPEKLNLGEYNSGEMTFPEKASDQENLINEVNNSEHGDCE